MTDHEDLELDPRLLELAREYNAPPATPREEMWAAIEAARRGVVPLRRRATGRWRVAGLAAAASLLLAAGVLAGRAWRPPDEQAGGRVLASTPTAAVEAPSAALRYAAAEHLARVEALLTEAQSARAEAVATRAASDAEVTRWAKDLLGTTRLLLDSRAADDHRLRPLLEDLELALSRIVQRQAMDEDARDIIDDVIERQGALDRLRTAVPAGALPANRG